MSLDTERERIWWRQRLMATRGGPEWLLHVARLYDWRERLLGPDHIGLPDDIRLALAAGGVR